MLSSLHFNSIAVCEACYNRRQSERDQSDQYLTATQSNQVVQPDLGTLKDLHLQYFVLRSLNRLICQGQLIPTTAKGEFGDAWKHAI